MRYSLMQDIANGRLDKFLDLQVMLLEEGLVEVMSSLQSHFRYYRTPEAEVGYYPVVHEMFLQQALMRQLTTEPTYPCPECKGEQEAIGEAGIMLPEMMYRMKLTCGHIALCPVLTPARAASRAVH